MRYDLLVIGNTKAGRSAARGAAQLGRNVAFVCDADEYDRVYAIAQLEWVGVQVFRGEARVTGSDTVEIESVVGVEELVADRIVICGSPAIRSQRPIINGWRAVEADEAQEWETVPSSAIAAECVAC